MPVGCSGAGESPLPPFENGGKLSSLGFPACVAGWSQERFVKLSKSAPGSPSRRRLTVRSGAPRHYPSSPAGWQRRIGRFRRLWGTAVPTEGYGQQGQLPLGGFEAKGGLARPGLRALKARDKPLPSGKGQGAEGRPAPRAGGERAMIAEGEVGERLQQGLGSKIPGHGMPGLRRGVPAWQNGGALGA